MKNSILLTTLVALMALASCSQKQANTFDWDSSDRIEYAIDYTAIFTADHDSTMQVTATSNYGTVKVVQLASADLLDANDRPVKNTFLVLEDSVPLGKSITLQRKGLSYVGGSPNILHVQTVGSDDLVEVRINGSDTYTLYSIRDNCFYGPDEQQTFSIPGGRTFSITLPIMTVEYYPRKEESHRVNICFDITDSKSMI